MSTTPAHALDAEAYTDPARFTREQARVFHRTVARTARSAVGYDGEPPLEDWLLGCVREAVTDLLREDAAAERSLRPLDANTVVESAPHDPEIAEAARSMLSSLENGFRGVLQEAVDAGGATQCFEGQRVEGPAPAVYTRQRHHPGTVEPQRKAG